MARLEVLNIEGKKTGTVDLDDRVFSIDVKEHVLWEVVKSQLACRRAGTHSTLRRSEVRGGGRKPYKQKGTGNARQGSLRSPHFVGGGSVFGPKPRDYSYEVPKKVRALALCGLLSDRLRDDKLLVVDRLQLSGKKTKLAAGALSALGVSSVAILSHEPNDDFFVCMRNLPHVTLLSLDTVNLYDLLSRDSIISTPDALKMLELRLIEARKLSA